MCNLFVSTRNWLNFFYLSIILLVSTPLFAAMPVKTIQLVTENVQIEHHYSGRVEAVSSVELRSRTEGFLEDIYFSDGQFVNAGDPLYRLDSAQHHTALKQAEARLQSARASLANSQQLLDRYLRLIKTNAISQNDLDNARTQRDIAQATLNQAEAELKTQQLNYEYTLIVAPISGRMGVTQVHVGSLINPATGVLVDIVQLDPIRVVFSVNEHLFLEKSTSFDSLTSLKAAYTPMITIGNSVIEGELTSVSNRIEPNTASVRMRAEFPNARQNLLPGGNVNIILKLNDGLNAIMLPGSALLQDSGGNYVFVAKDNVVEKRYVKLGNQVDRRYVVNAGLQEQELVIVDGILRVRAGMQVEPMIIASQVLVNK